MTDDHYFSPKPTAVSEPTTISVALPDGRMQLTTDRGVFSHGELDLGTRVLILKAPPLDPRRTAAGHHLLDLGCGAGPLAITLARRAPKATVWAVDVNARALGLTRQNAQANKVAEEMRICTPEQVDPDVRFDVIWSNPPIHIGKAAMHEMLLQWLGRLTPSGEALLVVQKHLGSDSLQRWLEAQGHPTERFASAKGFRILRVRARLLG